MTSSYNESQRLSCVAALYDIHGNLPALEAVLDELQSERVDRIVVGGDVFPGPFSHEVLRRLKQLDIPTDFIVGNCETALAVERAGGNTGLPEPVRDTIRWCAQQIDDGEAAWLAKWPLTLAVDVERVGPVLFCHGTPRDDNEIFTEKTPDERVAPAFANVTERVVVCGHTHMQFDRTVGAVRIVNAGSVGMPFGEPGADWLLIGPTIEFRHTTYDRAKAAERIRATRYPQADDFASRYVLAPPSAKQMLDVFTGASLKPAAHR
jgi:predicted phosphodiesterase